MIVGDVWSEEGYIRSNHCRVELMDQWSGEVLTGQVYGRTYDAPIDVRYSVLLDDGTIKSNLPVQAVRCSRSFCECARR